MPALCGVGDIWVSHGAACREERPAGTCWGAPHPPQPRPLPLAAPAGLPGTPAWPDHNLAAGALQEPGSKLPHLLGSDKFVN